MGYDMGVGINYGVGNDMDDVKGLAGLSDDTNDTVGLVDDAKGPVVWLCGYVIVVG